MSAKYYLFINGEKISTGPHLFKRLNKYLAEQGINENSDGFITKITNVNVFLDIIDNYMRKELKSTHPDFPYDELIIFQRKTLVAMANDIASEFVNGIERKFTIKEGHEIIIAGKKF